MHANLEKQKNGHTMDGQTTFWKAVSTVIVWVMVTGGIALGGVFLAPVMGEEVLGFFFMILAAAVVSMGFIWNWGQLPNQQRLTDEQKKKAKREAEYYDLVHQTGEKLKRDDQLANALRKLSDDELMRLRERIADGELTEADIARSLRD